MHPCLKKTRQRRQHPVAVALSLLMGVSSLLSVPVNAQGSLLPAGHDTPTDDTSHAPRRHPLSGWQWGLVLDVAALSRALTLGNRQQGLALGHSDLSTHGSLGRHLHAQLTVAAHHHHDRLDTELEESWLQTRTLPDGLDLRLGRFASQIGYLNEQHPHDDDFVERPLLYRAFLGGHWFDDGLRLNWTAPTALYLRLGAEVFRGRRLVQQATAASARRRLATTVLSVRAGDDIGDSHSWQAGIGWLHNRRDASREDDHHHDHDDHDHGHDGHVHAHGAAFSGRHLVLVELTWKWAPAQDNHRRQLRLHAEHARITGLGPFARPHHVDQASYLAAIWRLAPGWETGIRLDWLRVQMPHVDHFHAGRLQERSLMLVWKPLHTQSLRLQLSQQHRSLGMPATARSLMLHYVIGFGAHGAHAF
ncbi:MAG: hypothetical protein Q4E06_12055 [Lautropia sp.]|nr:hypothetical protein [Lautropia sp.]